MRIVFVTLAVIALSACGAEQPAQPVPSATPSPTADPEPTLPPPTKAIFAAAFAAACPKAKAISSADCQSQGFGKQGFACRFGLGDDPYERYSANLEPGDGKWVVADPATACAAGASSQ